MFKIKSVFCYVSVWGCGVNTKCAKRSSPNLFVISPPLPLAYVDLDCKRNNQNIIDHLQVVK